MCRIKTCFLDQLNYESFENVKSEFGDVKFDLIIDDGLHSIGSNYNTLLYALNHINTGGWIVIEDIYKGHKNNWFSICFNIKQKSNLKTFLINTKSSYMFCVNKMD